MALALVMVKKHTWGPLELANHHPFSTIYYEGPRSGHKGNGSKIYLLFLYVPDALGPGFLLHVIGEKPDYYLDRGLVGVAPLQTLLLGILWLSNPVLHELQGGGASKIVYRKNRLKNRLEAYVLAGLRGHVFLQKFFIRSLLYGNKMGYIDYSLNLAKIFSQGKILNAQHRHASNWLIEDLLNQM